VRRVSHSRAASIVAAAASRWILAATVFRSILATTASSRPSRPEFQHSYLTFQPQILATATVGTSSWRARPVVGNASMDDTDVTVAATFFFTTDGKSFMPTFNYFIHNMNKYRTSRLLVHLCLQVSFVGRKRLNRRGPKHGRIQRGRGRWHRQRRHGGDVIELYYM
jgi:hypothetical protein